MKNDLNYAVELIRKADGILITAGAGMSVDSGLPEVSAGFGMPTQCLKAAISISKILRRHWLMKFIKS
jgi:NAD-dependent SIR2 family protein deacetylase